jgi:hypothetical protein
MLMSHFMRVFYITLLCLFSTLSVADDFIDFEISANQLSSNYRAYIFFDGDRKYKKSIAAIVSKASSFDETLSEKPQILQQWKKLIGQVNRVLEDDNNIRNVNTQAHWEVMLGDLNRTLKEEVESGSYIQQFKDPNSADYIRLLLLRMEKTLASYMALTNPVGGLGISAESPDLEVKISEISEMLLLVNVQDDALKRVIKKWNFVKKILLKYNTDTAPYIVLHSYKKIRIDIGKHLASL